MLKFIVGHPLLSMLALPIGMAAGHIAQDAPFLDSVVIGMTGAVFTGGICGSLHRLIEERKRLASIRRLRGE